MYICVYSDVPGIAKIRVSVRQSALDLFSKLGVAVSGLHTGPDLIFPPGGKIAVLVLLLFWM